MMHTCCSSKGSTFMTKHSTHFFLGFQMVATESLWLSSVNGSCLYADLRSMQEALRFGSTFLPAGWTSAHKRSLDSSKIPNVRQTTRTWGQWGATASMVHGSQLQFLRTGNVSFLSSPWNRLWDGACLSEARQTDERVTNCHPCSHRSGGISLPERYLAWRCLTLWRVLYLEPFHQFVK